MLVRTPASNYSNMKFNIMTFCALLSTLFRSKCDHFKEILKVLQVLKSHGAYAMRTAYMTEVCWQILWAILHEGPHFFKQAADHSFHFLMTGGLPSVFAQYSQ
jgi:hypothetical protein